jgi:hypothetical protein
VRNFYQIDGIDDESYAFLADVVEIPPDLQPKGVLMTLYIDKSPAFFRSSIRNGYKSQYLQDPAPYSVRIVEFAVLTEFDDPPVFVAPGKYKRVTAILPAFNLTFSGEMSIAFSPDFFLQLFSRFNVTSGLFATYRMYFWCKGAKYEIQSPHAALFRIVKDDTVMVDDVALEEVGVGEKVLAIGKARFEPVDSIVLVRIVKKLEGKERDG